MRRLHLQSEDFRLILLGLAILGLAAAMFFSLSISGAGAGRGEPSSPTPSAEGLLPATAERVNQPTPQPDATLTPSPTSTASPAPTLTATSTPTPSQTPSPTPQLGRIWSKEAAVVYLRESPNGKVIVPLPNGMSVRLLGERADVAGLTWVRVVANFPNGNPAGWVAEQLILPQGFLPEDNLVAIQAEQGAYLRAEPGGRVLAFLWNGTLLQAGEARVVDEVRWVHVFVPDGRQGWVAEELLGQPGVEGRQP